MSNKPTILHMLDPNPRVSPFDVNMAVDAGFQHIIPYTNVGMDEVLGLTQDAIFSRGPTGVKATGLFIGGRDPWLALDMVAEARKSMVPPFEMAVFADPSGGFTTAAGLVAVVAEQMREAGLKGGLDGTKVAIFGGTGPVGLVSAVLAADAGAEVVVVSHRSAEAAAKHTAVLKERYGIDTIPGDGSSESSRAKILKDVHAVMSTAKAGIQILSNKELCAAPELLVAADVNAVPPLGLEGVGVSDRGKILEGTVRGARGVGALAVGDVKYRTQNRLFQDMLAGDGTLDLEFRAAMKRAMELLG